jgi:hypothetical protein
MDMLLAKDGRIAQDLQEIILKEPTAIADLLLAVNDMPAKEVEALTAKARKRRNDLGLNDS